MDERILKKVKIKLMDGPLNQVTLDMETFITSPVIFIPPGNRSGPMQIVSNPLDGYHSYSLWDNWPLRYKYSGTVGVQYGL